MEQINVMQDEFETALGKLVTKLMGWFEGFILMIPNLLVATLVFLAFYIVGKLTRKLLQKPLIKLTDSRTLTNLVMNFIFMTIMVVGVFISLSILKLDKAVTSLLAGAGIIGLALGFAFQDIAANLISGVIIAIKKPIRIDDLIETSGHLGNVVLINLRTTQIKTQQGQLIFIPNKEIYSSPIVNYSYYGTRRVDLNCGISYGENLQNVKDISLTAINALSCRLPNENVSFVFTEFGDSSINFSIRYWIPFKRQLDYNMAVSDGVMALKKAFDANGITIPFPIRTLDFGIKGGEKLGEHLKSRPLSS